jgi:hypothetical protein
MGVYKVQFEQKLINGQSCWVREQLTGFAQAFRRLYTGDFEMKDNQAFGQCYAYHQDQISGSTANKSTIVTVSHHKYRVK